ncbi:MAG TPA: hypothetical protein VLZ29_06125, partial [Sulfurimonas sp.]|uniref:hypothetical protein n=1 Tax=Sulfurimonas sp. TaxID=2022749 RepID=UPI002C9595BB
QIQGFTKDIDNGVIKEALESSMNVLVMGLMMLFIRNQEAFIQRLFTVAKGLIVIILASDTIQRYKNKLSGVKGFKFLKKFNAFQKSYADRVATAQLVIDGTNNHLQAETTMQNETNNYNTVIAQKEHLVNKERLHMDLANNMASRYNDSLIFKMFTKSFTPNDKTMIKKILGRDTGSELDINELNQVADFLYVKDSTGKVTGLSEQFLTMLNGLSYLHK